MLSVSSDSEPPSSPQAVEDGGEEDEEELSGGEETDLRSSSGRGSLLTRRGITLRVLLKDGLVEPGDGVLAIHYLVLTLKHKHSNWSQTKDYNSCNRDPPWIRQH